jgi:hypothetical protein
MFRRHIVFLSLLGGTIVFGQVPPGRSAQPPSKPASAARATAPTCDRLAAHPNDSGKPPSVTGVADAAIAPAAIAACAAEVQASPQSARLKFQLGRALWATKRYDEAIEAFLQAEESDYAPAAYYLGLAHERGLIEGEKPDLAAAADLYMVAASEGFSPAIDAYRGIEWDVTFDGYQSSYYMNMIYSNDFKDVREGSARQERADFELIFYIAGAQNFLGLSPNEYAPSCENVADPAVSDFLHKYAAATFSVFTENLTGNVLEDITAAIKRYDRMSPQEQGKLSDNSARANTALQYGTDDTYALVADYGGCSGQAFRQFYANLKAFIVSHPPVAMTAAEKEREYYRPDAVQGRRLEMAADWYRAAEVPADQAAGLVARLIPSQYVFKQEFNKGQQLAAWVVKGSGPDLHFTEIRTDPKALGIDPAGREKWVFEVVETIELLTAFTGPGEGAVLFIAQPGWESKLRRVN